MEQLKAPYELLDFDGVGWILDTSLSKLLEQSGSRRKFNPNLLSGKDRVVYDILTSKFEVELKPVEIIACGKSHEGKQWGTNWSNGKTAGGYYAECFYETVAESPKVKNPLDFRVLPINKDDPFHKQKRKGKQVSFFCAVDADIKQICMNMWYREESRRLNDYLFGVEIAHGEQVGPSFDSFVKFVNDPFEITLTDEYDNAVKSKGKRDTNGHRFVE